LNDHGYHVTPVAHREALAILSAAPTVAIKATMHESSDAVWFCMGIDDHEYPDDVLVTPLWGEIE
jgi:hypothetical protein